MRRIYSGVGSRKTPAAVQARMRAIRARNVCLVLGSDLATPSDFVICWTPDGRASGGTGQALRVARAYGIPVYFL